MIQPVSAPQPRFGSAVPLLLLAAGAAAAANQGDTYIPSYSEPGPLENLIQRILCWKDEKIAAYKKDRPTISREDWKALEKLRDEDEKLFHPFFQEFEGDLKKGLIESDGKVSVAREEKYNNTFYTLPVRYNGEPWEIVQKVFGSGGADYLLQTRAKTQHDGRTVALKSLSLHTDSSHGAVAGYCDYGSETFHSTNSRKGAQKAYKFFEQLISQTPLEFHASKVTEPRQLYGWLLGKKLR